MYKVVVGIVLVSICVSAVQAHDYFAYGREITDSFRTSEQPWRPNGPQCSTITQGQRSAYRSRTTDELSVDKPDGEWLLFGEHSLLNQQKIWNIQNPTTSTIPYACDGSSLQKLEEPRMLLGLPNTGYDSNGNPVVGAMSEYARGCAAGILDIKENVIALDKEPADRIPSGTYTMGMEWTFVNQGYNNFYSCTDIEVDAGKDPLSGGLLGFLAASAWFLIPLALLPVVAAAVYARRHKAESMRLSAAAGDRMSGVTAAPATPYRSGFTAARSSGDRMSGVTAAPATPYKSGLTGVADLDSARTASDSPGYRSGFTGLSSEK